MDSYKEYVLSLLEAQRYFTQSGYERLKKYKDDPNIFISYRSINKLGINPKSEFNTPNGIYAYPIKEIWDNIENRKSSSSVPYAGENPYIYVFKVKEEYKDRFIDDAYKYNSKNFDDDLKKLEIYFSDMDKIELKQKIQYAIERANIQNPFGIMWNITRVLSSQPKTNNWNYPNINRWNYLFRKVLGYVGVADRKGQGIIHPSEPTQAVFFSTEGIEELEVVRNVTDKKENYTTIHKSGNKMLIHKIKGDYEYSIINKIKGNVIHTFNSLKKEDDLVNKKTYFLLGNQEGEVYLFNDKLNVIYVFSSLKVNTVNDYDIIMVKSKYIIEKNKTIYKIVNDEVYNYELEVFGLPTYTDDWDVYFVINYNNRFCILRDSKLYQLEEDRRFNEIRVIYYDEDIEYKLPEDVGFSRRFNFTDDKIIKTFDF